MTHPPIRTLAGLMLLDLDAVVEGYRDGCAGFPCGDNRSQSYRHGHRNGLVDSGRARRDDDQRALARDVINSMRTIH